MSLHHTSKCLDEAAVVALLDGQLQGEPLARVEAHLANCEACRTLVATIADVAQGSSEDAAPGDVSAAPGQAKAASPQTTPRISLTDRYEILKFIAAGGMGRVYAAVKRDTGQRVAIKSLDEEGGRDAALIARFSLEGEVLRRLDHPNIVKLLEVFDDGEQRHLVMEYVAGGSLRDLIRREGPLPIERALRLVLELADALARAHHLGILHRDIKPANVLLAEDGTPRLSDFGLARTSGQQLTQTGTVLGTVPYLSPEGLWGRPLDARADLWSLGVTLFEMLSAQLPFVGETQGALVTAILHQPTPDLGISCPWSPPALVALMRQLLEKDPARRLGSARQLGAAVEVLLKQLQQTERATRPNSTIEVTPRAPGHASASMQALAFPAASRREGRFSRRAAWLAVFLFGVGSAIAVAGAALRHRDTAVAQAALPAKASPTPLGVDDFEDGDLNPQDTRFAHWQRYYYNSAEPSSVYIWAGVPGPSSNQSLHLAWLVRDARNGKVDHAGAGIRSLASNVFVDVSPYSRIVFQQRYQADAAFPPGWSAGRDRTGKSTTPPQPEREAQLPHDLEQCSHRRPSALVQFYCAEYNTFFEVEFPLSDDWQTVVVPLASLHEPDWQPATHTPLATCLAVSNGFGIVVQDNQLEDGQCHSGSLSVDDVSLR